MSRPSNSNRVRLVLVVGEDLKRQVQRRAHEEYTNACAWTRAVIVKALKEPVAKRPAEHRVA